MDHVLTAIWYIVHSEHNSVEVLTQKYHNFVNYMNAIFCGLS